MHGAGIRITDGLVGGRGRGVAEGGRPLPKVSLGGARGKVGGSSLDGPAAGPAAVVANEALSAAALKGVVTEGGGGLGGTSSSVVAGVSAAAAGDGGQNGTLQGRGAWAGAGAGHNTGGAGRVPDGIYKIATDAVGGNLHLLRFKIGKSGEAVRGDKVGELRGPLFWVVVVGHGGGHAPGIDAFGGGRGAAGRARQGVRDKGVDRPVVGSVACVVDTERVWGGPASPRNEVVEDPATPTTAGALTPTRCVRGPRSAATGHVDLPPTKEGLEPSLV